MALLQDEDTGDVTFDLATVYSVDSGGLRLILKNQSDPTQKKYKKLSSYESPQVGDRVVLMKMSGTYVVMGSFDGSSALPAANTVFAGPASGNPAAAAFRSLVEADLPTIPVNKGGTGATGATSIATIANVATAASGITISAVSYAVWGKIATLRILLTATAAKTSTAWNTVATVVSGKRPIAAVYDYADNSSNMQLATNGNLQYYGAITSGQTMKFVATYLLA